MIELVYFYIEDFEVKSAVYGDTINDRKRKKEKNFFLTEEEAKIGVQKRFDNLS